MDTAMRQVHTYDREKSTSDDRQTGIRGLFGTVEMPHRWAFIRSGETPSIYNLLGQVVMQLVNGGWLAGGHVVTFDVSRFVSGVYLYRLGRGSLVDVKKMVMSQVTCLCIACQLQLGPFLGIFIQALEE
jgi:hypothetical protein